jgi:hypothetical protein
VPPPQGRLEEELQPRIKTLVNEPATKSLGTAPDDLTILPDDDEAWVESLSTESAGFRFFRVISRACATAL